jgi:hypothetical protein
MLCIEECEWGCGEVVKSEQGTVDEVGANHEAERDNDEASDAPWQAT